MNKSVIACASLAGFIRSLEILEKFGISKISLQDLEKSCDSAKLMKLS
jgi:hypothetical protein